MAIMDTRDSNEKYADTSMTSMQIVGVTPDLELVLRNGIESSLQTANKWYELHKADDGSIVFLVYTKNKPADPVGLEGMII